MSESRTAIDALRMWAGSTLNRNHAIAQEDAIEYTENLERSLTAAHARIAELEIEVEVLAGKAARIACLESDSRCALSQLDDALGRLQQAHERIAELEAERERLKAHAAKYLDHITDSALDSWETFADELLSKHGESHSHISVPLAALMSWKATVKRLRIERDAENGLKQQAEAERERLATDAERWDYVARHWGTVDIKWNDNRSLRSIRLTIEATCRKLVRNADHIEKAIDAAIAKEKGDA